MAALSPEEENYVRMALLLNGISPRAVRALFDREFAPVCLKATLRKESGKLSDLKTKRVITQAQWNLLFPSSGNVESKIFDVTLMICLIRHLTDLVHPSKGFESLPPSAEITPCADLARIKYYRNYIAHVDGNKIDNLYFSKAWTEISEAIVRLGSNTMLQECADLKNKILDQSNQEIMLSITNLEKEMETLKKFYKDTIPWNVREQIQQTIETWRKNDEMFVDTRAAKHVLKCIKENNCVAVTASFGVGKTATVRHVALQMAEDGYDIIPIIDPCDISTFYNPYQKMLFVVDDLCGKYSLNQTDTDKWKLQIQCIEPLLKGNVTKIIVSCRLQVYQDEKFERISLFRSCECNLLSENLCLLETEKSSIATRYLDKNVTKVKEHYNLYDFFPLLCKLYKENPTVNISEFFSKPYFVYKSELDKLCKDGAVKFCALALCVMFNNQLHEKWLTREVDKDIRIVIKNTCEACKLSRCTPRPALRNELNSVANTFIRKAGNIYSAIHDKVFDFMAYYFGKVMITSLIKNANSSFISKRFVFQQTKDKDPFAIIVPTKYKLMYISRMIDDLSKNNVTDVLLNTNMYDSSFRQEFFCRLQSLPKPKQRLLAHTIEKRGIRNTVLLVVCFHGEINMLKWCIHYKVNVNHCRLDGISPLYVACEQGHTEIVNILLKNKADINKYTNEEVSPLYMACEQGHTEIVNILLKKKADIHKCRNTGASPLYVACYKGHTEIVNILLKKKSDINKCKDTGASPLYVACRYGHTEIVNTLLNNKADINKCRDTGESPLYVACHTGVSEIVNRLISNKADINKCKDTGTSPLYLACCNGHEEIVNILLSNKSDINKCKETGESPLYVACYKGYTEIVNILLSNQADINLCCNTGESPLYIACYRGHTEIVNILLSNKADINMCTNEEVSPLYVACQNGHTEILIILLNNKAAINKCRSTGESPLYKACFKGHTEIANILLSNKARINKCTNEEVSPLYVACQNGHTEIVNILLNNKADINKCTEKEVSPLYVACKQAHAEIVNCLLKNKADINKCRNTGESPLYVACEQGHTEIVNCLLKNKADINKCRNTGESPLYVACEQGHTEIVNCLLNNKADINKCRNTGESPLYVACEQGHTEIVNCLLNNKADINKCTDIRVSPLYIAWYKGHTEIVNLLLNNNPDVYR